MICKLLLFQLDEVSSLEECWSSEEIGIESNEEWGMKELLEMEDRVREGEKGY